MSKKYPEYPQINGLQGHRLASQNGRVRTHHFIVDKIIPGVFDPKRGHEVHHVDDDRNNVDPSNLVVCESKEYHGFLHSRTRALHKYGSVHYRICSICKIPDHTDNLQRRKGRSGYEHTSCLAKYDSERYKNRNTGNVTTYKPSKKTMQELEILLFLL